jgi:hypothetical protein
LWVLVAASSKEQFRKAVPEILEGVVEEWIAKLMQFAPVELSFAFQEQNKSAIRLIYERYLKLPKSTTIKRFKETGIVVGKPLLQAMIRFCIKGILARPEKA